MGCIPKSTQHCPKRILHRAAKCYRFWLGTVWWGRENYSGQKRPYENDRNGVEESGKVFINNFCVCQLSSFWDSSQFCPLVLGFEVDPWSEPIYWKIEELGAAHAIHPQPCPHPSPRTKMSRNPQDLCPWFQYLEPLPAWKPGLQGLALSLTQITVAIAL